MYISFIASILPKKKKGVKKFISVYFSAVSLLALKMLKSKKHATKNVVQKMLWKQEACQVTKKKDGMKPALEARSVPTEQAKNAGPVPTN